MTGWSSNKTYEIMSNNKKEGKETYITVQVPLSADEMDFAEGILKTINKSLKYISLVTLTVQNAALSLTMRMARTQRDLFISSTAVILAEALKLIFALLVVWMEERTFRNALYVLYSKIIKQPADTFKVAVPSIVYYVQNNLIYVGATHLDAATCQVTYQLKILTTALFSVGMLQKRLSGRQWAALIALFCGVALVQLAQLSAPQASSSGREQRPFLGFLAIVAACTLSGFAGVYFEKILKNSDVSLMVRNVQLSIVAIPFGLVTTFISDWDVIQEKGFFFGYSVITWVVILLQAGGGLIVAVVVKYADNILKGFATSMAIVLSCVVSIYAFEFHLTSYFFFGACLVISSIFMYSFQPSNKLGSEEKTLK